MVELHTTCGTPFFVDADVAEQVGHLAWKLDKDGYVIRKTTINGRRGRTVRLHRLVLGCTNPLVLVDHRDGNKLLNVRTNLREATAAENGQNTCNRGGFIGTTWNKSVGRWQSQIKVHGQSIYLGLFDSRDGAHSAYLDAKKKHHEFQSVPRGAA